MTTRIEEILKSLLQKNIEITIKNKIIKHGRLIIFRYIGCFIRLEISNITKREHIEIPFPFAIEGIPNESQFFFDYRLITLADGDQKTLNLIQTQKQIKDSKYYDQILTISVTNGN